MDRPASFLLKLVYCLTVLGAVVLVGMSSWAGVRLTLRTPVGLIVFLGPLLVMVVALHRIYLVVRGPGTLDAPAANGMPRVLRSIGVGFIYLGALAALLNVASKPITRMLMQGSGDGGLAFSYALIGIWVMLAAGLGLFGILVFEYSRLIAFEAQRRGAAADERPPIPAAMLVPRRR